MKNQMVRAMAYLWPWVAGGRLM